MPHAPSHSVPRWLSAGLLAVTLVTVGLAGACDGGPTPAPDTRLDTGSDSSTGPTDAADNDASGQDSGSDGDADDGSDGGMDGETDGGPALFGLDERPANPTCTAPDRPASDTAITLERAFSNLSFQRPVWMRQAPGDPSRWYLVEQTGRIITFEAKNDGSSRRLWADLSGRIESGGEKGLLGLAFHPDWPTTEKIYLSYTADRSGQLTSVISAFGLTADKSRLDPSSETVIFTLDQPFGNHNGGQIGFGPDGYLYAGFGDGGAGGDPFDHAENPKTILGSMIRIDVDATADGNRYAIPPDNPFADQQNGEATGKPEVYAWGLRNPWRFSWDARTGTLYAGDVGQNAWEEISIIEKGGNYGWNAKEGTHCFQTTPCDEGPWIDPIAEYGHDLGQSVTGGYVYRGEAIPSLVGVYLYADFNSGRIWGLVRDPQGDGRKARELLDTSHRISSFARAHDGTLYILDYVAGEVWRIAGPQEGTNGPDGPDGPDEGNGFPATLSETGCVDPEDPTRPAAGLIPYRVNAPFWSDGATKERFIALPDGATIDTSDDADTGWTLPVGTVVVKSFKLDGDYVETRLLVRHADGGWAGYSYDWNDAQTEATLLKAGKIERQPNGRRWEFPSRSDCLTCHTKAAGRTLGLKTAQLNGSARYPSTGRRANQLATLDHVGLFTDPMFDGQTPPEPTTRPHMPSPFGSAPLDDRARAYLHTNCAQCHRAGAALRSQFDVQWETPSTARGLCNTDPVAGSLNVDGAKLLVPGQPARSLIHLRPARRDAWGMPPLRSLRVDRQGVDLLNRWIRSRNDCP